MKIIKSSLLLFILGCCACSNDHKQKISIIMINSAKVKFTGVDVTILNDINRDTSKGKWQNLFPVYRLPADTILKNIQPVQPGTYKLVEKEVVFTPDTPFMKGLTYFVRYYNFDEGSSMLDIIRHKNSLGHHSYTDLIFKQ